MRQRAVQRLRPRATFQMVQDGTHNGRSYPADYSEPNNLPIPTEAEILATIATLEAEDAAAALAASLLRQRVRTAAQSTVGKQYDLLSQMEQRALLGVLLWLRGALNPDGSIKPLDEWAK